MRAISKTRADRERKACRLVCDHVPRSARVLEISCGRGAILAALKDAGYSVKGTNYTHYADLREGLDVDVGVDVLEGLPYDDGAFDCVVLLDVIEHLRDHERALAEIARVCSDGGHFLVMTPNTMRIWSRLHFLATGFFKIKRAFVGFDVPSGASFGFHNYPPHLPVFLYQLTSHGFEVVRVDASGYKLKSLLLWALFAPLIYPATYVTTHVSEKHIPPSGAAPFLFRTLTSFPMLCGEFWFLLAQKQGGAVATTTRLPRWAKKPS